MGGQKGGRRGTRALWVDLKRISKEGVLGRWDGHNEIAKRGLVMPGTAGEAGGLRRRGGGVCLTTSVGVERMYKTVCRHEPEQRKADQTW